MKLSTILIVKNEGKNLEACLLSISPFSDEIIIIDTGSTDRTKEIAHGFTSAVFDYAWQDDFSLARNFAIQKASGNLIFSIDADERISKSDWHKFEAIKKTPKTNSVWGFDLPVRHYREKPVMDYDFFPVKGDYPEMESMASGYILNFKILIFPNIPEITFANSIHETVEPSITRSCGKTIRVDIPVHHYGYLTACSDGKKMDLYEHILENAIKKKPDIFKTNYDYGHLLLVRGKTQEALPYIEKACRISGDVRGRIAFSRGIALFKLKEYDRAREIFRNMMNTGQIAVMYYLIQIALQNKEYEEALKLARKAHRKDKHNPEFLRIIYSIYQKSGKDRLARDFLQKYKDQLKK